MALSREFLNVINVNNKKLEANLQVVRPKIDEEDINMIETATGKLPLPVVSDKTRCG